MTNFIIFHFQDSHHDQKQIASGLSIVVCRGFGIGEMNWMIECHLIRAGRLDVRAESSFWEGSVLCIEMASDKSVAVSNILRLFTKCKIIACVIQLTLFWCILFLRQQIPICYSPKIVTLARSLTVPDTNFGTTPLPFARFLESVV